MYVILNYQTSFGISFYFYFYFKLEVENETKIINFKGEYQCDKNSIKNERIFCVSQNNAFTKTQYFCCFFMKLLF